MRAPVGTVSTRIQVDVEQRIENRFSGSPPVFAILRNRHRNFLHQTLGPRHPGYFKMDPSIPWNMYWCGTALDILGYPLATDAPQLAQKVSDLTPLLDGNNDASISSFGEPGGLGGGPTQLPHWASTYAAVGGLVATNTTASRAHLQALRESFATFMWRSRNADGSLRIHAGGEVCVRAAYCATVTAFCVGIVPPHDAPSSTPLPPPGAVPPNPLDPALLLALFASLARWVAACQDAAGGFGSNPGDEPHAAFTYCAVATLAILRRLDPAHCDVAAVRRWLALRQCSAEGGFSGRAHKLVDSCYSWWAGGAAACVDVGAADARGRGGNATLRDVSVLVSALGIDPDALSGADAPHQRSGVDGSGGDAPSWASFLHAAWGAAAHVAPDADGRASEGSAASWHTVSTSDDRASSDTNPSGAGVGAAGTTPPTDATTESHGVNAAAAATATATATTPTGVPAGADSVEADWLSELPTRAPTRPVGGVSLRGADVAAFTPVVDRADEDDIEPAEAPPLRVLRTAPHYAQVAAHVTLCCDMFSVRGAATAAALEGSGPPTRGMPSFGSYALSQYVMLAAQTGNGLADKPGMDADAYHTCYALAGMSVAQNAAAADVLRMRQFPGEADIDAPAVRSALGDHAAAHVLCGRTYDGDVIAVTEGGAKVAADAPAGDALAWRVGGIHPFVGTPIRATAAALRAARGTALNW